ncbi:MAG: TULIP family P47-like protein [Caldilineaceae bacterium]
MTAQPEFGRIRHVFCTVELNKYIDKSEGWKWTRPTDVGYAYVDGKYEQNSLLGILCMTGGRKRSAQQSDILDANAIPNGSVAGFLVAEKQFLEELIMPTIPFALEKRQS